MEFQEKVKIEDELEHYLYRLEHVETKFDRTLPIIRACYAYYAEQIIDCLEKLNAE